VNAPAFKVRIVRAPAGEAPEWVREAWVGLELPLACLTEVSVETGGVLSGPTHRWGWWWKRLTGRTERTTGWVVDSARAIALLSRTRPDAADWWRTHAPRFTQSDSQFVFDSPACEPSPEPIANAPWG
jgi:hypothetical protein